MQNLIIELKESFTNKGLVAPAEGQKDCEDVIPILRLMDCLIWDKVNPDEEAFAIYAGIK